MGNRYRNIWTDEAVSRLTELWKSGLTGSEIGAQFGVSRNAIIGKCFRMGLSERGEVSEELKQQRRLARITQQRIRRPLESKTYRRVKVAAIRTQINLMRTVRDYALSIAPADECIPIEQRKQLVDLNGHDCHWPVGDPMKPDFFYCGAIAEPDRPYCPAHCARAYE